MPLAAASQHVTRLRLYEYPCEGDGNDGADMERLHGGPTGNSTPGPPGGLMREPRATPGKGMTVVSTRSQASVRARLEAERDRLEGVRASLMEASTLDGSQRLATAELSLADQHPADVGTEMFEREKDYSILEQVAAEMQEVERALHRLEQGTYGICEDCGRPIAAARLAARPSANLCVDDQARRERAAAR
jgi:RNA polymerase-binding transcription factor DksA